MAELIKRISTHVLDVAQGKPASGVAVRLERREVSGDWISLGASRTDGDGRCAQLLPDDDPLRAGLYRLSFDTASYHHGQKVEGLYPIIEITFQVLEGDSAFHLPLLLSPFGYTTYRGS